MPAPPFRYFSADQFLIQVGVDIPSFPDLGFKAGVGWVWARMSGAEVASETSSVRPGGMDPAVVIGSRRTTGDITLSKPLEKGDTARIVAMAPKVGRARVTVLRTLLDPDGYPFGTQLQFHGVLKGITHPEVDADSTDAATWSITVTPDDDFTTAEMAARP